MTVVTAPRHIAGRPRRALFALTAGMLAVLLASSPVWASVTWSSPAAVSQARSYSTLNALGRTVTSGGTAYLHTAYTLEVVGGEPVQDDGPYLGIYYRRGNGSGSSWGGTKRLNAASEHGDAGTLATSGKYVYVAWRAQSAYDPDTFDPMTATAIRFVRNTNHGSSTAWSTRRTIVNVGLVDRPAISATGSRVYLVYTDIPSNEIRLWRSDDYGATWNFISTVGAANIDYAGGAAAFPVIAASGTQVGVMWNTTAGVKLSYSSDYGATFPDVYDITSERTFEYGAGHSAGRLVFATIDSTEGKVTTIDNGLAYKPRVFATFGPTAAYPMGYSPAVTITGTRIGVAWAACTSSSLGIQRPGGQLTDPCAVSSDKGVRLRWRESADLGQSWKSPEVVASFTASSSRRRNDFPSVLMSSSTRRLVLWNGSSSGYGSYRLWFRLGTGTK